MDVSWLYRFVPSLFRIHEKQNGCRYRMRFEEISPAEHPDLYLQPRHSWTIADGYWRECSIESNDLIAIRRQAQNKIRLARNTEWPLPYVRNVRLEERAGEHWLPMELTQED